jgi:phage-related protein (TIGR01555 family)
MSASANIVRDFVQTVLGIKGLTEMLRQGEDQLIAQRATIIDLTRSVANTVFTDADGETYSKQASSVAGLPELWDRFALHVSACTGIPATKLMGRSPAGMNATGESDLNQWYDTVQAYRRDELEPMLNWLVGLIDAQSEWRTRPEALEWHWPCLTTPSDAEWADIKLRNAQADAVYMDRGAIDPEYLYHLRYGAGEYRADINYDYEAFMQWVVEREGLNNG